MRYLFAVIADRNGKVLADHDEITAINAFNDTIEAAGHRVMAAGVAAPDQALIVDNRGGRGKISNGPVVDSELFMAGFWVIDADDESIARRLAAEASLACNRVIEVRAFLG